MTPEVALLLPAALRDVDGVDVDQMLTASIRSEAFSAPAVGESDAQLMTSIAAGSREALALLFRKHGRAVRQLASRVLRDDAEADDLRQEVFLYLFQKAALFDPEKAPAISWILQITYHRAINRRKYLAQRGHYEVTDIQDSQRMERICAPPTVEHLDGKAIMGKLDEQLSPDQRKTLELHICEGYSFREIAEDSGQTLGNVRNRYYRAIERLRANLFSPSE